MSQELERAYTESRRLHQKIDKVMRSKSRSSSSYSSITGMIDKIEGFIEKAFRRSAYSIIRKRTRKLLKEINGMEANDRLKNDKRL